MHAVRLFARVYGRNSVRKKNKNHKCRVAIDCTTGFPCHIWWLTNIVTADLLTQFAASIAFGRFPVLCSFFFLLSFNFSHIVVRWRQEATKTNPKLIPWYKMSRVSVTVHALPRKYRCRCDIGRWYPGVYVSGFSPLTCHILETSRDCLVCKPYQLNIILW